MAYIFVKTTDLFEALPEDVRRSDFFLQSTPIIKPDSNEVIPNQQYISRVAAISSFIDYILVGNRKVTGHWTFSSGSLPPEQTTHFGIDDYINNILLSSANRSDCISLNGNGYYSENETLFPHDPAAISSSIDVSQYSIPNLDYINRLYGYIFDSILKKIRDTYLYNFITQSGTNYIQSSVGDFVFSTFLSKCDDSNDNTNIKKWYGMGQKLYDFGDEEISAPNTNWVKHGEYVLRGANSGVVPGRGVSNNSNNNDVSIPLAWHGHTLVRHQHGGISVKAEVKSGKWVTSIGTGDKMGDNETSHHHRNNLKSVPPTFPITVTANASASIGDDKNYSCSTVGTEDNPKVSKIQPTYYCYIWERVQ